MERYEWRFLPHAGGLWDQPFGLMERLHIIQEEEAKYELYKKQAVAAKQKLNELMGKEKLASRTKANVS